MTDHILRNFPLCDQWCEASFVSLLHETGTWNDYEYFLLEDALFNASEDQGGSPTISRALAWPVARIFSYLFGAFASHLDPNDAFTLKHLNQDRLYIRQERLKLVFEGFFKGDMPNREHLDY